MKRTLFALLATAAIIIPTTLVSGASQAFALTPCPGLSAENPKTGEIRRFLEACTPPTGWETRLGVYANTRAAASWSRHIRDYRYEIISQTAHPILNKDQQTILTIVLKNTGLAPWYSYGPHSVSLGTANPRDSISPLISNGYLGATNRIRFTPVDSPTQYRVETDGTVSAVIGGTNSYVIQPGQSATFEIPIKASENGRLYFRPLVESIGWMKDRGIYWDVTAASGTVPIPTPTPSTQEQATTPQATTPTTTSPTTNTVTPPAAVTAPTPATPVTMSAPSLTLTSSTATSNKLSWANTGASYYQLYVDTDPNGTFTTKPYQGLFLTYTHNGLVPNKTYYYKLRAVSSAGDILESPIIMVTTQSQ